MILNRFLPLFLITFFFHTASYAQYTLVKNFDGGSQNSFGFGGSGIVYSLGSKVFVQYDSIVADAHANKTTLASIDIAGNKQYLAYAENNLGYIPVFYDYKTLPNGKVAFISMETSTSFKIIITDGTTVGTSTIYSSVNAIQGLEVIDNGLYFTYDGDLNHALMKIDLTTLAVSQVVEFGDFHIISDISKISNTSLIFFAPDPANNDQQTLYVSDGTSGGTTALAVLNTGSELSQNTLMTQVGAKVYFFYKKPGTDCCNDLWVTDGTIAGTKMLKEFGIVYFSDFESQKKTIGFNNKFYFAGVATGTNTNTGEVLWVSDGTTDGTIALTQTSESVSPQNLMVFKNNVYFVAFDGSIYDSKFYKTDGTLAGTSIIDLKYNTHTVFPGSVVTDGDYIYMGAFNANASFGGALFRYDGSNTQCAILDDVNSDDQFHNLYINGTNLYFTVYFQGIGEELYTTVGDFTPGATATKASTAVVCTVYPNPAKDIVTVKSTEKIVTLRLINQAGTVLAETKESFLNVVSYPAGVYYVEVLFATNESSYQKLILNK